MSYFHWYTSSCGETPVSSQSCQAKALSLYRAYLKIPYIEIEIRLRSNEHHLANSDLNVSYENRN